MIILFYRLKINYLASLKKKRFQGKDEMMKDTDFGSVCKRNDRVYAEVCIGPVTSYDPSIVA